jgi:hypothetical protein
MGFFAFAENPIFLFFAIRPTPFDRGLCFFARIYAVQRIPAPFVRPFSIDAVAEIWGTPHSWKTDFVRPSNFVVCAYGHIFAREKFPFSKIKDAPPYRRYHRFFHRLSPFCTIDKTILHLFSENNKTVSC